MTPRFTETVHVVRASLIDGSICDLLLFAKQTDAADYLKSLSPLPTGFTRVDVVERSIIGTVAAVRS